MFTVIVEPTLNDVLLKARRATAFCRRTALCAIALLALGCASAPPDDIVDSEAALIYGEVLRVARDEFDLDPAVPVHPYVAVLQDSLGVAKAQFDDFEFEKSAPLAMLERTDSTLTLCQYNNQGVCASSAYLIVSQIKRTMERDASVVVLAIDTAVEPALRYLLVELKYSRDTWRIVDTQLACRETWLVTGAAAQADALNAD